MVNAGVDTRADVAGVSNARVCPRCGRPVARGPRAKWYSENCR